MSQGDKKRPAGLTLINEPLAEISEETFVPRVRFYIGSEGDEPGGEPVYTEIERFFQVYSYHLRDDGYEERIVIGNEDEDGDATEPVCTEPDNIMGSTTEDDITPDLRDDGNEERLVTIEEEEDKVEKEITSEKKPKIKFFEWIRGRCGRRSRKTPDNAGDHRDAAASCLHAPPPSSVQTPETHSDLRSGWREIPEMAVMPLPYLWKV
ncbi:uncharacterized protein LOC134956737 isoform X2 [Pseudophryne corroboree]|uniref:uncharacterized protein LOC134956737 isoform X2 n=1 Tax=Pseudophryne corroboree TaxID=495146 RepID=UPI00308194D0